MRLLRSGDHNRLSLTKHKDDKLPPYAILSHTWSADDDEVSFHDVNQSDSGRSKAGYAKVLFCGQQAQKDNLKDFWVDTCCIRKDSDAELSEALNSMFRWYKQSAKYYGPKGWRSLQDRKRHPQYNLFTNQYETSCSKTTGSTNYFVRISRGVVESMSGSTDVVTSEIGDRNAR